jgi:adenylosuccinate lyase
MQNRPLSRKKLNSMNLTDVYDNPLVTRYASREMAELWGPQRKFSTWRRLWLALAQIERELGLTADDGATPRISAAQIEEMRAHLDDIDFARAEVYERRLRHDVMAHIRTFADACPSAGGIIHLGATSCYVTDNTDLILMRDGLGIVRDRLIGVIDALARFAEQWRDLPTLGYTHYQPAQLTTVGKRACLWCADFIMDLAEVQHRLATLKFRGTKGTTGTQASFLSLFRGNHDKVRQLDALVARKLGFDQTYAVTGQTHTRKVDSQVLDTLSGIGQSAHKYGTDLRLLAHEQELEEAQEAEQVGSSAMAYKRNPMRAERMCGLARFLTSLPMSAAQTAATQWLERTLDDSVNRRLTLPQSFLTADAILRLALNITNGLTVNPEVVARNVERLFPYMATENILMDAAARGGDRQELHERIRQHSHAVTVALKQGAPRNDLLDRLRADPAFAAVDFNAVAAHATLIGRAPQQVDEFLAKEVAPIRNRYSGLLGQRGEISF